MPRPLVATLSGSTDEMDTGSFVYGCEAGAGRLVVFRNNDALFGQGRFWPI